ncbi:hypothetical protein [Rufibacter ruber]|uniref:hypothetical protein n=1 Tax=Rufibacter ruber TaxID=1783499 RepID=UPI00082B5D83|nr:hypothetical protein [Rufibacter ruber]
MFKKFLLVSWVALAMAAPVFAQESGSEFKPQAGEITAEVQLNLTNSSGSTITLNGIRGRYFLSPTKAFRLGISGSINNSDLANDVERTSSTFRIPPGIENHFTGTERLSPYIGS